MENQNNRNQLAKISRRGFLQASVLAMAPLVGIESVIGTDDVEFTRHTVRFAGASSESITIVQLSDLHLRTIMPLQKSLAERVNAVAPDAIVITGDAIDGCVDLELLDNFLRLLRHSVPKVAILGNHERESNIDLNQLARTYETHNGSLLVNRTAPLAPKGTLSRVLVTGLDDSFAGNQNLEEALRYGESSPNHILMVHRPKLIDETDAHLKQMNERFNLMLAGHTHGGQVNIFGFVPALPIGSGHYVKGWYRNSGIPMYVSRGIGTVVIPVRIGAKPEVAIFKYYLS